MKKKLQRTLLCASLIMVQSTTFGSGIPVVDVAHIAQTVLIYQQHVKELAQLIEQVKTAKNQLEEAKKTLSSITGARGMANLVNMTGIRQALPAGFMTTVDSIRSLGAAGASKDARAIYDSIKRFGCDQQHKIDGDMRRLCEVQAYSAPTTLSMLQDSVKRSETRSAKLGDLLRSIDTGDAKAAMDLQNRIQVEVAMLANEKMLMDMALQSQKAQQELVSQQLKEIGEKNLTSKKGFNPYKN